MDKNNFSLLFELGINAYQGFIFMFFCYRFLGNRHKKEKGIPLLIAASAVMALAITSLNYVFIIFNEFEIYVLIGVMMIYSFTCLGGKVMAKIFVPIFTYSATYGTSAAIEFLVSSLSGVSMYELMSVSSYYRVLCVLLINLVFTLLLLLVLRFKGYKFNILKWTDWVSFIVIPIVSIIIVALTYSISLESNLTREHSFYLGLIAIGILIVAILTWIMLIKISKDSEFKLQYMLLQQQYKYQHENILQANKSMKSISALRHDMRNKLLCIGELIKCGDMDKALDMCGACQEEIQNTGTYINTKNIMLNAIVNVKLARASENFINAQIVIGELFDDIADTDLCIMLGNILDNAVEAVSKMPEDNREIKINLERKGGYRSIMVKNTISKSILKDNPLLKTTKGDKSIHGIGIRSVDQTVKKYKGDTHYYEKAGFFCAGIILPIPNLPK